MSAKPKITVIIPCYNSGRFLLRSVESILSQTYKNFELLIINDGSNDKITLSIIEKYKRSKKIKILNQKNYGLSSARNLGIKSSKTKFLLMLDADDWIAPATK